MLLARGLLFTSSMLMLVVDDNLYYSSWCLLGVRKDSTVTPATRKSWHVGCLPSRTGRCVIVGAMVWVPLHGKRMSTGMKMSHHSDPIWELKFVWRGCIKTPCTISFATDLRQALVINIHLSQKSYLIMLLQGYSWVGFPQSLLLNQLPFIKKHLTVLWVR